MAFDQAKVTQIQRTLKDNGIDPFVDIEFPPMMSSLHDPSENFPQGGDITWKRAKEFAIPVRGNRPQVLTKDPILPSDIVEGSLGDSWFASAVACLAEKENLLRKLFITPNHHEEGVYKV